jgi:hypothetical protein
LREIWYHSEDLLTVPPDMDNGDDTTRDDSRPTIRPPAFDDGGFQAARAIPVEFFELRRRQAREQRQLQRIAALAML